MSLLPVFLGIYPEVELLDSRVVLYVYFRNHYIVFCPGCIILHHHQQCTRVPVSPHPHQHLFSVFGFLLLCFKIYYFFKFIFDSIGSLLLPGLFYSCSKWGLLSSCGSWASHCSDFSCCRAQALGVQASVVAAPGL